MRRRGGEGAVLNSKAEFNWCYLPRLKLVEEEETVAMEQAEEEYSKDVVEELQREEDNWITKETQARTKGKNREKLRCSLPTKHPRELEDGARPSKRGSRMGIEDNRKWNEDDFGGSS